MKNSKNKKQKLPNWVSKGTISKSVRDYGNDPFFVKQAEDARKFLEKNGFPECPKKK